MGVLVPVFDGTFSAPFSGIVGLVAFKNGPSAFSHNDGVFGGGFFSVKVLE